MFNNNNSSASSEIAAFERYSHLTFEKEVRNVPRSSSPSTMSTDTTKGLSDDLGKLNLEVSVRGSRSDSLLSEADESEKVRAASFTSSGDESGLGSRTGSMSAQKDSGMESSDAMEFPELTMTAMNKITSIVEWYFSDENLAKDSFLLKHISRNREGYVSLKLVSSLRKVKSVTKDWKEVAESIRKTSKKLIMNDEVTKIKRIEKLSPSLLTSLTKSKQPINKYDSSKLMLVSNISSEKPLSSLTSSLSAYGDISFIRLYRDNTVTPPNTGHILNNQYHKERLNSKSIVAIVQYEMHESVEKAVKCINEQGSNNWRSSMKATILADQNTFDIKYKTTYITPSSTRNNKSKSCGQIKDVKSTLQRPVKTFVKNLDASAPNFNCSTRLPIGPDPTGSKGFVRKNYHF